MQDGAEKMDESGFDWIQVMEVMDDLAEPPGGQNDFLKGPTRLYCSHRMECAYIYMLLIRECALTCRYTSKNFIHHKFEAQETVASGTETGSL